MLPGTITVATDESSLQRHKRDFTLPRPDEHLPLAVIYPRSTQEISEVLRAASQAGVAIVPQGGLTGMAGGALPSAGSIALSLEKMCGIVELDTYSNTVTVLAGTRLQVVQEAALAADRFLAVDFGSRGTCTIGGAIANNAGGNRVLRFGMMREQVLGLEVVLADGTVVSGLNKMIKNNTGYDLRNIFIGSEGTLGVVACAVLRLFPAPRSSNTMLCAVSGIDCVHQLLALARSSLGAQLSAFEVMWRDFYDVTHMAGGRSPLAPDSGTHFVLLEALGSNQEADEQVFASFAADALEMGLINDAAIAQSLSDAQGFWRIRDSSGDLTQLWGRGPVVNFDVSVPVARVEEFVGLCREALSRELSREAVFFGHIADSNMHLAVPDPSGTMREEICKVVYSIVRSLCGSVSAEHGIGLDKRNYLAFSRSAEEIDLMRRFKQMLDPRNILNPGKVLPPTSA
ncbi:MAG: FAD-binding oxidoreductase [Novosphingobium sp.]